MTAFSTFVTAARRLVLAFGLFASFSGGNIATADEQFVPRGLRACTPEDTAMGYAVICKEALPATHIKRELDKLQRTNFTYEVQGDTLVVAVRMTAEEAFYPNGPYLCCEIQAYLDKISEGVYSASFRWARMADAMLDLRFMNVNSRPDARLKLNGPSSFVFVDANIDESLIARSGAELLTSIYAAGDVLGLRKLSVFRGSRCLKTVSQCAVIYMPDGEYVRMFVLNALANKIDMSRFVVAGVHNADQNSSDARIEELLLGLNDTRYDAFMRFITRDVRQHVEHGEKPHHRYAAGLSNGGSWAYNALGSQSEYFDGAIIMSPGERKTQSEGALAGRIVVIGAGYMETNFYKNTSIIAAGLKSRGASVNEVYVASGHGLNTWINIWNAAIKQLNDQAKH